MNILFVHETDYINKAVFEYQIIPEILSSKGHKVYVMECPMSWEKKSLFDLGTFRTSFFYNVKKSNKAKGVTVIRPGFLKIPVLSRISAFFTFFFVLPKIIKHYKIDKIVLYAVPTNGLQTMFWAKRFKVPVHFRMIDILHRLVPYKILSPLAYMMEKMVYKRVDQISAITPKLIKYGQSMGGRGEIIYLPTGSDADFFYPQKADAALRAEFGVKSSDKLVLFSGTLYNFSGLDRILNYFADHLQESDNVKFLIVGRGEQLEELKKIVQAKSLEDKVKFAGFVEYGRLVNYINIADICINPFETNYITDRIFPSKVYQYLACEKPVIATKLPGMIDVIPDNGGENNVYYFDLDHIKDFFDLVSRVTRFKKCQDLSLQEITDKLEKMLTGLSRLS